MFPEFNFPYNNLVLYVFLHWYLEKCKTYHHFKTGNHSISTSWVKNKKDPPCIYVTIKIKLIARWQNFFACGHHICRWAFEPIFMKIRDGHPGGFGWVGMEWPYRVRGGQLTIKPTRQGWKNIWRGGTEAFSCPTHIFARQGFCVYEALTHLGMIMCILR